MTSAQETTPTGRDALRKSGADLKVEKDVEAVRARRLRLLQSQIEAGLYVVDATAVAEAILRVHSHADLANGSLA